MSFFMDRMAADALRPGDRECPDCKGTGYESDPQFRFGPNPDDCAMCFGTGFHPAD